MAITYDKARKTYRARFYVTDTVNQKRKYYSKRGFRTKKEATVWIINTQASLTNTSSKVVFNSVFREYLSTRDCNNETLHKRQQIIHDYFPLASKTFTDITKSDLFKWRTELKNLPLSVASKNRIIRVVKAVFNYGEQVHDFKNPSKAIAVFKEDYFNKKEMEVWSVDEFNRFIEKVKHPIYKAFFTTLFWTGMRRGECIALTSDDLRGNFLRINKSMKHYANGFLPTKNASSIRNIHLDDNLAKLLQNLLNSYPPITSEHVFLFGNDYPLSVSGVAREFSKGIRLSGVKPIRLHDLRHSHATVLINSGVNIVAVSKRLGHSNTSTTLSIYTHLLENTDTELVNTINTIKKQSK